MLCPKIVNKKVCQNRTVKNKFIDKIYCGKKGQFVREGFIPAEDRLSYLLTLVFDWVPL